VRARAGRSMASLPKTLSTSARTCLIPCGTTIPNSARCARNAFASIVCCRIRSARARCSMRTACWSALLTGTNRMFGRLTASQIASASMASFFPRLTYGFTKAGCQITWAHCWTSAMVLQTIISIEPDPGTNMQLRSHFLGALPQIGADQGHEHWTEGKGPCPRLLGQIAQIGTLLHGGFPRRVLTSRRLRSCYSNEYCTPDLVHPVEGLDGNCNFSRT